MDIHTYAHTCVFSHWLLWALLTPPLAASSSSSSCTPRGSVRPPSPRLPLRSWKVTRAQFDAIVASTKDFGEDSLAFMSKVLHRSGLGDETYAPPSALMPQRFCVCCGIMSGCTQCSMAGLAGSSGCTTG
jgi:FAE1/Type III polyketide synthase-like protein